MQSFRAALALAPLLLLAAPAVPGGPEGAAPQEPAALPGVLFDGFHQGIFFAVLEGLYRDGVSDEVVDALLVKNDAGAPALFVTGCPICTPALDALRVYRARPRFAALKVPRDTFGDGLDPELSAACTGPDVRARFDALQGLVRGWVADYLASRRLTDEEHEAWAREMEVRRKKGMEYLAPQTLGGADLSFRSCALCEAANEAARWR